ncbi:MULTISPECIES: type II toxin-antitoxin system RelE/ParE family toxin [Vibrio]|uniref:type II toxin-antitoxin system RelE/ParE family toxin n=1 Tax=Vibrio TaxID=662 RepID=UPI0010BDB176|nr:type II toxin-antitoxin system RelE/ParE family toxin [Vibrio sp. F12]TKE77766.1 type II toxin-antitoxin system RelE/ParE family toxin [Vibrio sp. F12]
MYKLSQKAADDFGDIYEYTFLNFGEDKADGYTEEMEQCLTVLSEDPFIGRDCSELRSGVRRHDHQKHVIFYRVREFDVFVIRILHQQMNPMLHL